MSRFLLPFLMIAGCQTEAEDLSGYLDRNPALRTLQFGYSYALTAPAGMKQLGKQTVADDHAFLLWTDGDCDKLAIHTIEDAESNIRAPRQIVDQCDGVVASDGFDRALAAGHGMLIVGTNLFRATPDGYAFDLDLATILRRDQQVYAAAVLDDHTIVISTDETAYLFVDDGTGWTQVDRLDSGYYGIMLDGDRLGAGNRVYQRNGETWEQVFELNTGVVRGIGGDVLLGSSGNGVVVYEWDASRSTYARVDSRIRDVRNPQMIGDRIAYFDNSTLKLVDRRWNLLAADGIEGATAITTNGDEGIAVRRPQYRTAEPHWVKFTSDDPVAGEVLRDQADVAKDEQVDFSMRVPEGARSLEVTLSGTGDADLYVRFGSAPTLREYDCSPYRAGSNEVCTFRDPAPGTWHVGLVGFDPSSEVSIVAVVD